MKFWPSFAVFVVIGLIAFPFCEAAEPIRDDGILRFRDGDYLVGGVANSDQGDQLHWQHPKFASPFAFSLSTLSGISFAAPATASAAKGEICLELSGGDQVFGTIIGGDREKIQLRTARHGDLSIRKSSVHRLLRWANGKAVSFIGPGKIENWQIDGGENEGPAAEAWQDLGGQLRTEHVGASIYRDIGLTRQTRVDIELSWEAQPNFIVAIGVFETRPEPSAKKAFRLEVWGKQLVAIWESDDLADVALLGKVSDLNGALELTIEIDQQTHDAVIRSRSGEVVGELHLAAPPLFPPRPGIWIKNLDGVVQLENLQVVQIQSPGRPTSAEDSSNQQDIVLLENRDVYRGIVEFVDADEWMLTSGDDDGVSIKPSDVRQIDFSANGSNGSSKKQAEKKHENDLKPSSICLATQDGFRVTGRLQGVTDGMIRLSPDAIESSLSFPADEVRSLDVLGAEVAVRDTSDHTIARLQTDQTRLHGRLVDSNVDADAPLNFQPNHSLIAAAVLPGMSGKFIYRDPPPPRPVPQRTQRAQNALNVQLQFALRNGFAPSNPGNAETKSSSQRALHLRTGEVIPAEIKAIDERGIVFSSNLTTKNRLSGDMIQAIELVSGVSPLSLDQAHRERLLTVPRNRKKNAPTHLVVAKNGDILRCRLISMDEDFLEVESRLETIQIDRRVVTHILWLDASESDERETPETISQEEVLEVSEPDARFAAQAVLRNGNRLSFVPTGKSQDELIGTNVVLGRCTVAITDLNELIVGRMIETESKKLPYGDWELSDAPEPTLLDDAIGGANAGMSSALVGQVAPGFTLELLDGGQFHLADQVGKVVVLDFWATWCGPCLQAMPVIEATVSEFETSDVMLLAVNLQETADPIRKTLERLQIKPAVAMDIDGVAAGRYQADAIPQTVVIGRDGKILRLFVGGGAKLGEQLRDAIREAVAQNR